MRRRDLSAGEGSLTVYESEAAGASGATLAAFLVEDLDDALRQLRARGVRPIDYDLPHLRTHDGVATIGRTSVASIADPDGNLLAVNTIWRFGGAPARRGGRGAPQPPGHCSPTRPPT
jgi:hypothetical protein